MITELAKKYPELKYLSDPQWRLHNLYYIRDVNGKKIKFTPNWAQQVLLDDSHNLEIVLKCRQIGITTYYNIIALDRVLWTDNYQAGIIAQTFEDASRIFKDKLKFAFDHLHPGIKPLFKLTGDSAKELAFTHGSVIRVGTSLRSHTLQMLHISEFGKICAKDPERAREIVTGSLNTVHKGQTIIIESTAEGNTGYFFDMCKRWENTQEKLLGLSDYRFRFFPWHKHPDYIEQKPIAYDSYLVEYFDKLYTMEIKLNPLQKNWYAYKWQILKEDTTREYPSYPDEAFSASKEGYWYASVMKELHESKHITNISYDKALPVHTSWDLGQADLMAIWFFQINRQGEVMIIDYFQRKDCDLNQVVAILQQKGYVYGTHIWPHDANARDRAGVTFVKQAAQLNLKGFVLEIHDKQDGIRLVRTTLAKCWFDQTKCKEGINALENYKKRYNSSIGGFTSEDIHDDFSHGADAFRYLCSGLSKLTVSKSVASDFQAARSYWGG